MKKLEEELSIDGRLMRVVMSSPSPLDTFHKLRTDQISIGTFLDTLEFLDAKITLEEYEAARLQEINKTGGRA